MVHTQLGIYLNSVHTTEFVGCLERLDIYKNYHATLIHLIFNIHGWILECRRCSWTFCVVLSLKKINYSACVSYYCMISYNHFFNSTWWSMVSRNFKSRNTPVHDLLLCTVLLIFWVIFRKACWIHFPPVIKIYIATARAVGQQ